MNPGPTFALLNRALRIESRTWRGHGLRFALSGILLLMVWQQAIGNWRGAAGKDLLALVSWTAVVFFTLFAFSHFTSAITEEKEEGTLGLMRLAGLSPASILLGKGAARLCDALMLAVCVLPFAVLAVTLGGVTLTHVVACALAVAAHAVLLCGLGLLCSTVCGTLHGAGALLLIMHLGIFLIPPWLGEGLRHVEGWEWLSIVGIEVTSWGIFHRLGILFSSVTSVTIFSGQVLASLVGGLLAFTTAWLVFDRCAQDGTPAAGSPLRSHMRWRRILGLPRPPTGLKAIGWKDYHITCGGRWGTLMRLFGLVIISVIIGVWGQPTSDRDWNNLGIGALIWALVWIIIETGAMLARLLAVEVREQTLDGLLLLPITPRGIILHKLRALPLALFPALLLGALGIVVAGAFGTGDLLDTLLKPLDESVFWSLVTTVIYFWSLCLWLSLRVKRAPFVMALMGIGITWFLVSMLAGIFSLFRNESSFVVVVSLCLLGASAAMFAALPGMLRRQGER